jgi:hypothetical protein
MSTTTKTKQPAESKQYAIDFANLLADGDSIASITSVTGTPTGLTIEDEAIAGTTVTFTISGGTDGTTYAVEALVATTDGEILEGDGWLKVEDIPTIVSPAPTGYTRHVLTMQDCYERAVNFLRANGHDIATRSTGPPELLIGAICDAYEHVLNAYDWPALQAVGRIQIHAERTTGTVVYTHSSRQLAITDGTFPTWCEEAAVRFDDMTHQIQSYVNSTTVVLDEYLNPGEDVASTTYRLWRWWYELPRDFGSCQGLARELRGAPYVSSMDDLQKLYRRDFGTGYVETVAFGSHPTIPSRQALYVYPPSTEDESIDFPYTRRPRDLRFAGYTAADGQGTVTLTASSNSVTGSGTAFTDEMEGAMLRVSSNTTRPTGTHGLHRYAEQHPILTVDSTTALTLGSAAAATRSGVAYIVTDPILIDYAAYNAVLRRIEFELATMFRSELLGTYRANADEALRYGMQGAAAWLGQSRPRIGWDIEDGTVIMETE